MNISEVWNLVTSCENQQYTSIPHKVITNVCEAYQKFSRQKHWTNVSSCPVLRIIWSYNLLQFTGNDNLQSIGTVMDRVMDRNGCWAFAYNIFMTKKDRKKYSRNAIFWKRYISDLSTNRTKETSVTSSKCLLWSFFLSCTPLSLQFQGLSSYRPLQSGKPQ